MEKAKIIYGDCLRKIKKIKPETIQAVITDPPYCSGGATEASKMDAKGQGLRSHSLKRQGWFEGDNMTSAGISFLLRSVAMEAGRVLRPGGHFLFFADWRMVPILVPAVESANLRYRNLVVWNKMNTGLGHGFRPSHEILLHFCKSKPAFFSRCGSNVISVPRVTKKTHPTEKPVELFRPIIEVVSQEGDTILDPFAGSAPLGEACIKMNRGYIGIEQNKKHFQTAKVRISKTIEQEQTSLFGKGA